MNAPPGWYPDPEAMGRQRFWDGQGWTDEWRPWQRTETLRPSAPPEPPSTQRRTETVARGLPLGPSFPSTNPSASAPRLPVSAGSEMKPLVGGALPPGPRPVAERRVRRGLWSGMVTFSAILPVAVGSLGIVAPLAYGLHLILPVWGASIPFVVWLALNPLLLIPAFQRMRIRHARGVREPIETESSRLEQPWRDALRRAEIPAAEYRLMVAESGKLNACRAIGRIVVVTSHSVGSLTPGQLEAVLVHELGHRLGWRGPLGYVRDWLMLPTRALSWLLQALWSPVTPMWRRAVAWHRPIGFLLTFLLAIVAAAVSVVAALPAAVAAGGARLARLSTGQDEFHADTVAVRLGLGPDLLSALEHAIGSGQAEADPDRPQTVASLPLPLVRRTQRLRIILAEAAKDRNWTAPPPAQSGARW